MCDEMQVMQFPRLGRRSRRGSLDGGCPKRLHRSWLPHAHTASCRCPESRNRHLSAASQGSCTFPARMRLIRTDPDDLGMEEFSGSDVPPYAILSHCWAEDAAEVSIQDFIAGRKRDTSGFKKIVQCCRIAQSLQIDWVWVDTCCIDKTSSAELSESINSMYSWYDRARYCFVFLQELDVDLDSPVPNFTISDKPPDYPLTGWDILMIELWGTFDTDETQSEDISLEQSTEIPIPELPETSWFTRGWTLQELLAGERVLFFDRSLAYLGSRQTLAAQISDKTEIPSEYLSKPRAFQFACVAQKMSWAADRKTKRAEDAAYCLMGLFDVNMPLLYGEGLQKAFHRLQTHIMVQSDDDSLFAWRSEHSKYDPSIVFLSGLFAESPNDFRRSGCIRRIWNDQLRNTYRLVNQYIEVDIRRLSYRLSDPDLILNCYHADQKGYPQVRIPLCYEPFWRMTKRSGVCRLDSSSFGENISRGMSRKIGSFFDRFFLPSNATTKILIHHTGRLPHEYSVSVFLRNREGNDVQVIGWSPDGTYLIRRSLNIRGFFTSISGTIIWAILVFFWCVKNPLQSKDSEMSPFITWAILEIGSTAMPDNTSLRRWFVYAVYLYAQDLDSDSEDRSLIKALWRFSSMFYLFHLSSPNEDSFRFGERTMETGNLMVKQ